MGERGKRLGRRWWKKWKWGKGMGGWSELWVWFVVHGYVFSRILNSSNPRMVKCLGLFVYEKPC